LLSLKGIYLDWAKKNQFQSMLPKDAQRHCDTAVADYQTHLNPHLKELPIKEHVTLYTDEVFLNVTIEWLVLTDQVSSLYNNISVQFAYPIVVDLDVSAPGISKNN